MVELDFSPKVFWTFAEKNIVNVEVPNEETDLAQQSKVSSLLKRQNQPNTTINKCVMNAIFTVVLWLKTAVKVSSFSLMEKCKGELCLGRTYGLKDQHQHGVTECSKSTRCTTKESRAFGGSSVFR
jgi:hypothetical protein